MLFGKYDLSKVTIGDEGLARYINLEASSLHHHGIYANHRFGKSKMNIIERLINNMMRTENHTGKKTMAIKIVRLATEIIEKRTKNNPVQILINALEKAAPREEATRLFFGGISVPQAVDTSPQRRLDIALRNLCKGAVSASRGNKRSIQECLADEIIKASNDDPSSFAIAKKGDIERIAKSAR